MVIGMLKEEAQRSPVYGAGLLMAKGAFRSLKSKVDYSEYGGAPLLGVNGACLIAHGRSSPKAIRNADPFRPLLRGERRGRPDQGEDPRGSGSARRQGRVIAMHDGFDRTARIAGLGGYLPERVLTNHDLEADRRDHRRVDHQPHRDQGAADGRRRRGAGRPRRARRQGRARRCRRRSRRGRSPDRGHRHGRAADPGLRRHRPAAPRPRERRLLRPVRGLLRLHLRPQRRPASSSPPARRRRCWWSAPSA